MDTEKEAAQLWSSVRDLYVQLHAFVRAALVRKYGNATLDPSGLIPVHLLGGFQGVPNVGHDVYAAHPLVCNQVTPSARIG